MEALWKKVDALGLELYDMALMTKDGLNAHRFRPASNCHNGYSVTKAFVVTAVGLLFDEGRIRPEDKVGKYLNVPTEADPRWHEVTVHHLLTHTAGIDKGFLDIDVEDMRSWQTEEYLDLVFARPLPYAPGTHAQYSDGAFYALSRIVGEIAGETADALLGRRILRPMDFGETAWSRCPKGHPIGATGLYAQAEDVVKLGWLYLSGGMWQGKRLLSEEWVRLVIENGYEFHPAGNGWIGKAGMYGQQVAFHPGLHAAVAWHAFEPRMPMREILDCLTEGLERRGE